MSNIKRHTSLFFIFLFISAQILNVAEAKTQKKWSDLIKVKMETTYGDIELELNHKKAPLTVKNFMKYVDEGFYKNTIFHRVISNFMIQGGGFTSDLTRKKTRSTITNEASNGLSNEVGTIAMARTRDINSATSQFFINVNNNQNLNHTSTAPSGYGYAVFGKVTKGMTVINKIKLTKTKINGNHRNFPIEPIKIKNISIIK